MKYLPWIVAVLAFVLGFLIGPKPDPEVSKLFKEKQIILQQQIDLRDAEILKITRAGQAIREKAVQDSIRFAGLLKAKDMRITDLKRKVNEFTLENATTLQLDSIALALYGPTALHQP